MYIHIYMYIQQQQAPHELQHLQSERKVIRYSVCCSVLQCVAVCCSVLQCAFNALHCVLPRVALCVGSAERTQKIIRYSVCCSVASCSACCSVLQCVLHLQSERKVIWYSVCCSVLQCSVRCILQRALHPGFL